MSRGLNNLVHYLLNFIIVCVEHVNDISQDILSLAFLSYSLHVFEVRQDLWN